MAYRTRTYTLKEENVENGARYFISFKDGPGKYHELEVSHAFYLTFRRLELDNRKLQNWDWRHSDFFVKYLGRCNINAIWSVKFFNIPGKCP